MIGLGGWDFRNLLQGHTMAILFLFVLAFILLGIISFTLRGSIAI